MLKSSLRSRRLGVESDCEVDWRVKVLAQLERPGRSDGRAALRSSCIAAACSRIAWPVDGNGEGDLQPEHPRTREG
jgi:hypothetical protein